MVQSFLLWLVVRHVTLLRSVNVSQSWTLSFWNLYLASYLQISGCVPAHPAGQICRMPHNHSDSKASHRLRLWYMRDPSQFFHVWGACEVKGSRDAPHVLRHRVHGLDRKIGGGLEREEGTSPFSLSLFSSPSLSPPPPLLAPAPQATNLVFPVALSQFFLYSFVSNSLQSFQ